MHYNSGLSDIEFINFNIQNNKGLNLKIVFIDLSEMQSHSIRIWRIYNIVS